jgi:hypothetical protein
MLIMKTKATFYFFLVLFLNARAQVMPPSGYKTPEQWQPESLSVHLNSTFFLTGESLLFNIYCFTKDHPAERSPLSSIAYIELIGEDQKPFVQMKVKLQNGIGSGDFFFPSNVPSGNYTFIAYTKWMRNFSPADFFRQTITVINPQIKPTISDRAVNAKGNAPATRESNTGGFSFSLDKQAYSPREKISLQLTAGSNSSVALSVNVRLLETELTQPDPWREAADKASTSNMTIQFLPDVRSELISGIVTDKATGKPIAKGLVALSAPAKNYNFIISTTDSLGHYYFNKKSNESGYLLLSALGRENDDLSFQTESSFLDHYEGFAPAKLVLDTNMTALIGKRYLSVQVENAFYEIKKDSLVNLAADMPFFTSPNKVYRLDDFTRFPTMEDVFREIVSEVVVRIRDGNFSLLMNNSTSGYRFVNPPLVLVDGIPVADANVVMRYDPLLIKQISLVTQHYYYGGMETDGILSIETYNGDAKNIPVTAMTRVNYISPLPAKVYYTPQYESQDALARTPDFRTQLYWNPSININPGTTDTLNFFSGDLAGKYFIEIVGITSTGERIYQTKNFEVK